MLTKEMITALKKAKQDLISAAARGSGVAGAKEKMKNLLFNYREELIEAALKTEELQAEMENLNAALEESDIENDELRKQIKELKGEAQNAEAE